MIYKNGYIIAVNHLFLLIPKILPHLSFETGVELEFSINHTDSVPSTNIRPYELNIIAIIQQITLKKVAIGALEGGC